ncbi:hypothetical protein YC2023_009888 [Brassica napus]
MEMISISLCFATILAFLFLNQILKRGATSNRNRPPSPRRLPLIGNLHQLSLHPHRSLSNLSLRYGPLMLLHFGRVPIIVVSSADIAHDVMKTHDLKFANRPKTKAVDIIMNGGRDVAFSSYGKYWRQMKSVCSIHLLSKKLVRSFENIREAEIVAMMEKLEKASSSSLPVNLSESLLSLTNNVICRIAMGRKYSLEENPMDFGNLLRTLMELPVGDYIRGLAWIDKIRGLDRKMEEVCRTFMEFLEGVLQEHVDEGEKKETFDFVDMLLRIQRDKTNGFELDRSDIRLIMLDIFLGGMTTTYTTLDWAMMRLIDTQSFFDYILLALLVPRQLSEDVKLKGYDIAAGTQVLINAWAIHRDTTTWGPDAEEFKPDRHLDQPLDFSGQDFKFIPFGSGRRLCPGIGFAMALIEVTLANLVNRFNWKVEIRPLGDDDQYYLAEATGIEVCRKFPLFVFPSLASSTL